MGVLGFWGQGVGLRMFLGLGVQDFQFLNPEPNLGSGCRGFGSLDAVNFYTPSLQTRHSPKPLNPESLSP